MKTKTDPKFLMESSFSGTINPLNGEIVFSITERQSKDEIEPNYYEELMDLCDDIQGKAFDLPVKKVGMIVSLLRHFSDDLFIGNSFF
jgi:hypothetical protein